MQLVALKNLGFSFGEGWIFRNLNLEIQQGDFIAVIGANGAGKSTLLRVIAHILPATEGDVFLFGESLQRFRDWKKIGYVPQNPARQQNSFPISVREVVQLGRLDGSSVFKRFNSDDHRAVDEIMQKFGLEEFSHRKVGELSGGQQQRVFLARAMVNNPDILLLDEPATGVDTDAKAALYQMLGKLNQQGKTIIMVSHDLDLADQYARKALCLDQGLCFWGNMHDALKHRHKHGYFY
jgi:ABC-type Mn/Zn transport systems, ATPase component